MNAQLTRPKPMAIRRGDDYVVINIPELDVLSAAQRLGIAILVWQQMKWLLEVNGVDTTSPYVVDLAVGKALQIGHSSMMTARLGMKRHGDEHFDALLSGELSISEFLRRAGMARGGLKVDTGSIKPGKDGQLYFGKGDRFDDAVEPIHRYLLAWRKKNFEFRHLPPKEARKRLHKVRGLIEDLQRTERDLEERSHSATLRAPSERKEKHQ